MGTVSVTPTVSPVCGLGSAGACGGLCGAGLIGAGCGLCLVAYQTFGGWFVSVCEACAQVSYTGCAQCPAGVWHLWVLGR